MSSKSVREAIIRISAINKSGQVFGDVMRDIDKTTGKIEHLQGTLRGLSNTFAVQGAILTASVTAPIKRIADQVSETIGELDTMKARLAATMGVGTDELGAFYDLAEKLALSNPFTETQNLGAAVELSMAGFDPDQVLKEMPDVLNFAVATQIEIPRAAELSSDVLRGLGAGVDMLPDLMDKVAYAATKANQTSEQFMQGLVRFSPIARQMNMDVDQAIAMLSNLADSGFKAAEGGNALRTIMLRLSAPTKAARKQLASLGIDLSDFSKNKLGADSFIRGLQEAGVATQQELQRFSDQIDTILANDPTEGMTRGGMITELLTQAFGVDGATRDTITKTINDTLNASAAGVDVQSLLEEINRKIAEKGVDPLPIMKNLFGAMRSAQGGALLADIDTIQTRMADLNANFKGMAGMATDLQMETMKAYKQVMQSAKEVMQRNLWERGGLGDFMVDITKKITNLYTAIATLPDPILKTVVNLGKLAAAAGPALLGVAALTRVAAFALSPVVMMGRGFLFASGAAIRFLSIRRLLSPLTLVAAGVGALGFKLFNLFGQNSEITGRVGLLGEQFNRLWNAFKSGDGALAGATLGAMKRNVGELAAELGRVAKAWAESVGLGKFMEGVQAWSAKAADAVGRLRDNLKELNIPVIGSLGDAGDLMKWAAGYAAIRVAVNRLAASSLGRVVGMLATLPSALRAGAGMSGLMRGAMAALAGVMGRLGRFVFSPKSMGIVALTEAAFALRNAWADIGGDLGKEWRSLMDSFAVADFSGMTTALGNIGKIAWPSIRDSLLQPEVLAFMGAAMAWNVAGALMKKGPWVLAGRAAGALFSMSFKGVGAIIGLGGAVASKIGSSVALGMSTKVGAMGLKVMRILGKGLLRAIPFFGWGLLAYEAGKMIWNYLPDGMKDNIAKVGEWFSDKMEKALAVTAQAKANIKECWSALGEGVVEFFKNPFGSIASWFEGALTLDEEAIGRIKSAFANLGSEIWEAITSPISGLGEWIADQFTIGGSVNPEDANRGSRRDRRKGNKVEDKIPSVDLSSVTVEPGEVAALAAASAITRATPNVGGVGTLPLDGLDLGLGFELGGNGLGSAGVSTGGLLSDKGSEMNVTLRHSNKIGESITSTAALEQEVRGLRADMRAGLITSKFEGEADVRVKVTTPPGTSAITSGMSSGNVSASLNAGTDDYAP